jgi:hypothetical protein
MQLRKFVASDQLIATILPMLEQHCRCGAFLLLNWANFFSDCHET